MAERPVGGGIWSAPLNKLGITDIKDGTATTIMVGDHYLNPGCYSSVNIIGMSNKQQSRPDQINAPGTPASCPENNTGVGYQQDNINVQNGSPWNNNFWGSPHAEGGLFCMADGSVHQISYDMNLSPLLKTADGVAVNID